MNNKHFLIYKPYGMLCQFSGESSDSLLGDLYSFPKDVYPVGRLDKDSEGLLLLTNDNKLKAKILEPTQKQPKTYLVQVEGAITDKALELLSQGKIIIKHKGKKHKVARAKAKRIDPPTLPERSQPIRYRKNIPTSWISLTLTEGKNRQVRKMTATTGFPTLRLIRSCIGHLDLNHLQGNQVIELEEKEIKQFYS